MSHPADDLIYAMKCEKEAKEETTMDVIKDHSRYMARQAKSSYKHAALGFLRMLINIKPDEQEIIFKGKDLDKIAEILKKKIQNATEVPS